MEMYDVLEKLKAIENPTEDTAAAIKSAEAMTKAPEPAPADALETNATGDNVYQEYAPTSEPADYARLAGVQTLSVQTEPTNESVETEEEVLTESVEEEVLTEGPTRKDFQMVADLIKNAEPAKKAELAQHHADVFAKQNPRFDKERFMAACGVEESVATEEEENVNEATKEIEYGDWIIRYEVGKKDGEPVKWMTWHTDGGPESAIKGQSSSEDSAEMDAKKEGPDSIPALRKAYKGPVKVVSWIKTHGGQTDAVLLKKGNEYALGTDLAYMDYVAWWQSSPEAHWEEYTMLAKQYPEQGYWHWKSKDELRNWIDKNPKLYRKNIEFGADITDPEGRDWVTGLVNDDKNREEVETIELDEAYDPAHVAGIVKKHEANGHEVEMDPFKDDEAGFTVTFKDGSRRHYHYTKSGVKVDSLEPVDAMVDPDAPKRERGRPKKEDIEETEVDELTRAFESKYAELTTEEEVVTESTQLTESVQLTQSIDDQGNESVNINAQGDHVDMVKQLLALSGMRSDGYKEYKPEEGEEEANEALANSPDVKHADVDTQLNKMSGGLNGPKDKSALRGDSVKLHDSKDLEESLLDLYKEYKG